MSLDNSSSQGSIDPSIFHKIGLNCVRKCGFRESWHARSIGNVQRIHDLFRSSGRELK